MQADAIAVAGRSAERPAAARERAAGWSIAAGALAAVMLLLAATATVWLTARTGLVEAQYTVGTTTLLAGLLGALLIALRPRNTVGWSFLATGLAFTLGMLAAQYAALGLLTRPGSVPAAQVALWVQSWIFPPALIPMFVLVPLHFPDGS